MITSLRPRVTRIAMAAALVLTTASGCAASPATVADSSPAAAASSPANVASRTPAVSVRSLAKQYRGLPVRVRVTGPDSVAVRIRAKAGGRLLARGRTDLNGTTTLTWTWNRTGRKALIARIGSRRLTTRVRVYPPKPPTTPATSTAQVLSVLTGGNQQQYLDCAGQGGPTVVLVPGAWGTAQDWDNVIGDLRQAGRVCRYDRPGLGQSPGRQGDVNVDSGMHADELRDLLRVAGERGPFEVVGHSYGGMIAQSFASRYPRQTAGMVLLDPVPLGFQQAWPEFGAALDEATPRTYADLARSSESAAAGRPLVGMPLILVSAGVAPSWLTDSGFQVWRDAQAAQVAGCANCLHWVAEGATHQLPDTAPQMTISAIEAVRASVRAHVRVQA
ncbi:MAG: alpha/beta hydrolase [Micrococcales bacterium]|nr:alpha/beta hydrolase [Micrococcales bacterium]